LYYESFEKHGYFSNCGTSELIFLAKRQLYHYLLEGALKRAIEESFCCAATITFLPQKTADILNYAHHLLQAQVDPKSTLCNWLFNR